MPRSARALATATLHSRRGIDEILQRLMRVILGPGARWRERSGRPVRFALPFNDIMEIALALLALSPTELKALDWSFSDRKRLLDHFLASGKAAQRRDPASLGQSLLELRLPLGDVRRLRKFIHRELPKAASGPALLNRLAAVLDAVC